MRVRRKRLGQRQNRYSKGISRRGSKFNAQGKTDFAILEREKRKRERRIASAVLGITLPRISSRKAGMGPGKGAQPPRPGRRRPSFVDQVVDPICRHVRERVRREYFAFMATPRGQASGRQIDKKQKKAQHDDRFTVRC